MNQKLKLISFENQKNAFPLHFHKEYCFSLIRKGTEVLQIKDQTFYGNKGDITLTHPNEIHSNPQLTSSSSLSFDTIYIGEEIFKYCSPTNDLINFDKRVLNDHSLTNIFTELRNKISDKKSTEEINETLKIFILEMINVSKSDKTYIKEEPLKNWDVLEDFIDKNIYESLKLEDFASLISINKFGFSKKFKSTTGISPMNYFLMKKVFHAKGKILKDSNLKNICYDYNFVDLAHFSRTFKRFIGVSPKVYQTQFL